MNKVIMGILLSLLLASCGGNSSDKSIGHEGQAYFVVPKDAYALAVSEEGDFYVQDEKGNRQNISFTTKDGEYSDLKDSLNEGKAKKVIRVSDDYLLVSILTCKDFKDEEKVVLVHRNSGNIYWLEGLKNSYGDSTSSRDLVLNFQEVDGEKYIFLIYDNVPYRVNITHMDQIEIKNISYGDDSPVKNILVNTKGEMIFDLVYGDKILVVVPSKLNPSKYSYTKIDNYYLFWKIEEDIFLSMSGKIYNINDLDNPIKITEESVLCSETYFLFNVLGQEEIAMFEKSVLFFNAFDSSYYKLTKEGNSLKVEKKKYLREFNKTDKHTMAEMTPVIYNKNYSYFGLREQGRQYIFEINSDGEMTKEYKLPSYNIDKLNYVMNDHQVIFEGIYSFEGDKVKGFIDISKDEQEIEILKKGGTITWAIKL